MPGKSGPRCPGRPDRQLDRNEFDARARTVYTTNLRIAPLHQHSNIEKDASMPYRDTMAVALAGLFLLAGCGAANTHPDSTREDVQKQLNQLSRAIVEQDAEAFLSISSAQGSQGGAAESLPLPAGVRQLDTNARDGFSLSEARRSNQRLLTSRSCLQMSCACSCGFVVRRMRSHYTSGATRLGVSTLLESSSLPM